MVEHLDRVIFIVAGGDESFASQQSFRIGMCIEIRDVTDVVPSRLEPIRERKFPKEPFTRAGRKRRIEDLAILPVGAVVADVDATTPVPLLVAVVVKRELARPAIVGLPGVVRTLEQKISLALIAHDEDQVALQL